MKPKYKYPQQTLLKENNMSDTSQHDTFRLFGMEIINVTPAVALAFFMTMTLVTIDTTLLFVHPEWINVLLPILISITSFWIPSPVGALKAPLVQVPVTLRQMDGAGRFTATVGRNHREVP